MLWAMLHFVNLMFVWGWSIFTRIPPMLLVPRFGGCGILEILLYGESEIEWSSPFCQHHYYDFWYWVWFSSWWWWDPEATTVQRSPSLSEGAILNVDGSVLGNPQRGRFRGCLRDATGAWLGEGVFWLSWWPRHSSPWASCYFSWFVKGLGDGFARCGVSDKLEGTFLFSEVCAFSSQLLCLTRLGYLWSSEEDLEGGGESHLERRQCMCRFSCQVWCLPRWPLLLLFWTHLRDWASCYLRMQLKPRLWGVSSSLFLRFNFGLLFLSCLYQKKLNILTELD